MSKSKDAIFKTCILTLSTFIIAVMQVILPAAHSQSENIRFVIEATDDEGNEISDGGTTASEKIYFDPIYLIPEDSFFDEIVCGYAEEDQAFIDRVRVDCSNGVTFLVGDGTHYLSVEAYNSIEGPVADSPLDIFEWTRIVND